MNNHEDIDEILIKYEKYIRSIVSKYKVSKFDQEDLFQAGLLGLFKAIKKYDSKYNAKLSTFAFKYIIGEVNKEYNKLNLYGRSDYNKIRKYVTEHIDESLDEISKSLNISVETIYLALSKSDKLLYLDETMIDNIIDNHNIVDFELSKEEEMLYNYYYVRKFSQGFIAKLLNISQPTVSRMIKSLKLKIGKNIK